MPDTGSGESERVMLQVRLPKDLIKQLDHACIDWDLYRAELVEQLLRKGLKDYDGPESVSGNHAATWRRS